MSITETVTKSKMTELKYVAKISRQGKNRIIWIPQEYLKQVEKMMNKQVLITINDEWQQKV